MVAVLPPRDLPLVDRTTGRMDQRWYAYFFEQNQPTLTASLTDIEADSANNSFTAGTVDLIVTDSTAGSTDANWQLSASVNNVQTIGLAVGNGVLIGSTLIGLGVFPGDGNVGVQKSVVLANFVELTEMTAPAAGAVNTCRLYAQDNGAGKTQLMALFNTGAAQQVAIQP